MEQEPVLTAIDVNTGVQLIAVLNTDSLVMIMAPCRLRTEPLCSALAAW